MYGKTRTEVRSKLLKAQREQAERRIATASPTLAGWLDYWLEHVADIRPSTRSSYDSNIRVHLKPALGAKRLDRIEVSDIRGLYARMRRDGKSDSTIRQVHAVLSGALIAAVREGKVSSNVADSSHMKPPKGGDNPRTPLTLDQAKAVLAAAKGDPYESRWYAALYLGLRQGEALGLTWDRVDLTDGVLVIDRALQRIRKEGLQIVPPKSKHSDRVVPMFPLVAARLTVDLARHHGAGGTPDALVWTYQGRPISSQRDGENWRALLAKAGVPHVALHAARNTTATLLTDAGVPDKFAAEILGHADVRVTQKHYQQGNLEQHRAAMVRMQALIEG